MYTSSGSILIEQEQTDIKSVFSQFSDRNEINFLLNEIEILQSRAVREKTAKYLYDNYKDSLILFGSKKPKYTPLGKSVRNIKNFIFPPKQYDISTYEKFVQSPLYEGVIWNLKGQVSVSNPRKTDIIIVRYTSYDKNESAIVLNALINQYKINDQEWAAGELIYLDEFLTRKIIEKEKELEIAENNLMQFQEINNIAEENEINNLLIKELTEIESDYFKVIAERNIESRRKEFYINQLSEDEKKFTQEITSTLNIQLQSMRENLSKLETELISIKATKGANHPAVNDINAKIRKLKIDLKNDTQKYIDAGISSSNPLAFRQAVMDTIISISANEQVLLSKENELSLLTQKYDNRIKSLPSKFLQFTRLKRNQAIVDETYKVMKRTLEETRISKASELGRVRIIDTPYPPLSSSSLGIQNFILLGLILGLGLSIIIIGIKEYFDNTIKSIDEIERRGLSILSIIPKFESKKDMRYISLLDNPKSIASESYRNLRTSLSVSDFDSSDEGKIVLISSPGPKEGKSTTSTNLALTYALAGKKVLFIDLDLRKPVIHNIFGLEKFGVSNYFADRSNNINKYVQRTDNANLDVLCSGPVPPNPSELLSSKKMRELLHNFSEEYDYVIIDSPPFIAVSDSYILAKIVDQIVLVVRSHGTQKAVLSRVVSTLTDQNSIIDGIAFNGAGSGTGYYGGYYYNYYQEYYAEEDKED